MGAVITLHHFKLGFRMAAIFTRLLPHLRPSPRLRNATVNSLTAFYFLNRQSLAENRGTFLQYWSRRRLRP
jgi:hypothetical protein